jgi:phosphoribosylglycinamide formyltransferase-1
LAAELAINAYPGRGIVLGRSACGEYAIAAYFIMGRSANSRNRVFVPVGDDVRTQAADPSKVDDPSLILYTPVRTLGHKTIVTNGDHTDTLYDALSAGKGFAKALRTRTFEPDAPHYTPRIAALLNVKDGTMRSKMAILRTDNGDPARVERCFFEYEQPRPGEGRLLHTYRCDGNPLPSFWGEPLPVYMPGDIDRFTTMVWNSLHDENKISLFVRTIHLKTGETQTRIVNKYRCTTL